MLDIAIFMILPFCLCLAAFTDLFYMKIPNWIPAVVLGSFLVIAPFSGLGWPEIGMSFAGAAIVFSACFALFALGVMGGGDAKLLTAASVWFGFGMPLVGFIAFVSYIGGFLTLVIVLLRTQSNLVMAMGLPIPNSLLLARKIPYGIAIAIGGFMAFTDAPMVAMRLSGLH